MTAFDMVSDVKGFNSFALPFASLNYSTILAATVEQNFTVPNNTSFGMASASHWIAVFSFDPGTSVWVSNNTTAAIPGGSFAQTASQLNPAARIVSGGDVLSFITADSVAEVGVELYEIT